MPKISSEKAVQAIGNRFDLVLIAAIRQRELERGYIPKTKTEYGHHLTALQEIEDGLVGRDYLKRLGNHKELQKDRRQKNKFPKNY
jgi:DNA-directed RNA polymerase omega subunit